MHPTIHSTQVVTPFGSGYVPEDHGRGPPRQEPPSRLRAVMAVVFTVGLISGATAAAITANSRDCGSRVAAAQPADDTGENRD